MWVAASVAAGIGLTLLGVPEEGRALAYGIALIAGGIYGWYRVDRRRRAALYEEVDRFFDEQKRGSR